MLQASPKPGWHEQEQLTMPMPEADVKELTAWLPASHVIRGFIHLDTCQPQTGIRHARTAHTNS